MIRTLISTGLMLVAIGAVLIWGTGVDMIILVGGVVIVFVGVLAMLHRWWG